MTHLHLDPLGGLAGDMFAAAMLDAFPEHAAAVAQAVRATTGAACSAPPHADGTLTGHRFVVGEPPGHHHHHAAWRDIRARLQAAALDAPVRTHALGIFQDLAQAEASIHGVAPDEVTFHEVGATDSIADIVAAAVLIAAMGEATWSLSPLPLGSGRIDTAHGILPVPAPATALLLQNFATFDDGIAGERVTPTGAALAKYLRPASRLPAAAKILQRSGTGFGTRKLPGISNCLRILVFGDAAAEATHRRLTVIAFEVDDQTAEDLSAGLDRLRALPCVHDVLQMPAIGKKGRMATHVQVLARPEATESVAKACFEETTTIGLRIHHVEGRALARRTRNVEADGQTMRVKIVERPGGPSAKTESDDGLAHAGHATRAKLRRDAERLALEADAKQ